MPCQSYGPDESNYSHSFTNGGHEYIKIADAATRAACDLRTILRRGGKESDLTEETKAWIKQHDELDAKRVAIENECGLREKTRQTGLAKLTLDERRALGL